MFNRSVIAEQQKAMLEAKKWFMVKQLDSTKHYISDFTLNADGEAAYKYYNKKEILQTLYEILIENKSPIEFLSSLKEVQTIYRDGRVHDVRCEYAIRNSCFCWCGEKYHGWKGSGLHSEKNVR